MNFTNIKETCVYLKDLQLAKEFYNGKLGLEIISEVPEKHIFFRAGSSVLLCFNPEDSKVKNHPPAHFATGPLHFAFEVTKEDYSATKERILSLGIEILDEVNWSKELESFYFKDPEGNVLEVVPTGIWD